MPSWVYLLLAAAVFFLMMRGGCGAHVTGHSQHGGRSDDRAGGRGPGWTPPAQAIDPVCGMTVDTKTAKTAIHAGTAYYFCSPTCREKFESAPERYIGSHATTPDNAEHHHG